jgi:phosphoribosylglycinamide formyltransferase-1
MARESPLGVGVLASGTGSLLQAILDAQDDLYRVVVVLSDRRGVKALERAERAGVPAVVVDWKAFGPQRRDEFSRACGRALRERGVELACSAGFMRILSPVYFEALGVPAMNSHPSLLPSFPGAHAVRDALSWGARITGTTIHFVDEEVDHGPIIVQEAVAVEPGDTEETLHERVKAVERRLYPDVIRLFARGRLTIEGRRVHVIG